MITLDDFGDYIGEPALFGERADIAERCVQAASEAIAVTYRTASIPAATLDLATLQVASEMWVRRSNPGGIVPSAFDGGVASRLSRDALISVRSLLAPYARLVVG